MTAADPATRIDHLYRTRRVTYRSVRLHGEELWADALPAGGRPAAMAAAQAAYLDDAHLYGLDKAATFAALTLSAGMVAYTTAADGPGVHRVWSPVASPPTTSGLLRWASGVGYDSTGIPVIVVHWGPIPEGTWLMFWADNREAVRDDITHGQPRHQARLVLHEYGPLGATTIATALAPRPDAQPPADPPPTEPPHAKEPTPRIDPLLALIATVLASWTLLTPGAARLIEHNQPGRKPPAIAAPASRPAALASGPTDTHVIQQLGKDRRDYCAGPTRADGCHADGPGRPGKTGRNDAARRAPRRERRPAERDRARAGDGAERGRGYSAR
ncbi:hypothetical protein OHR68_06370 [Spirillospora sp. NBC_00431]